MKKGRNAKAKPASERIELGRYIVADLRICQGGSAAPCCLAIWPTSDAVSSRSCWLATKSKAHEVN
jgi:hypothetical protein